MKLLNLILSRFGLIAIPIKPSASDIRTICYKKRHDFGLEANPNECIARFGAGMTDNQRKAMLFTERETYDAIVELNTRRQ